MVVGVVVAERVGVGGVEVVGGAVGVGEIVVGVGKGVGVAGVVGGAVE